MRRVVLSLVHLSVGIAGAIAVSGRTLTSQQVTDDAATATAVYIRAPRTNADPRAKLVQDLRTYFREHPKERVRVVDDAKDAQFAVDVKRPDVTSSVSPYIESGAGGDRVTATAVYIAGARVCASESDSCRDFTASAKLTTMATLQLAEQIAKHVTSRSR